MTNEDLIYYIQRMPRVFGIYGDHDLDCVNQIVNRIKSQEEENTKLKAEIERLNTQIAESNKEGVSILHDILELREENEKLKSELEQSVKLPCKVGDMVYDNDFGKPTPSTIVGYSFGNIFQDDYSEIEEEQIYFYSKSNRFNIETSFASSEIGKTIFLNKKEAEQSLKGQTEE